MINYNIEYERGGAIRPGYGPILKEAYEQG